MINTIMDVVVWLFLFLFILFIGFIAGIRYEKNKNGGW
jgi:hypothetical protein